MLVESRYKKTLTFPRQGGLWKSDTAVFLIPNGVLCEEELLLLPLFIRLFPNILPCYMGITYAHCLLHSQARMSAVKRKVTFGKSSLYTDLFSFNSTYRGRSIERCDKGKKSVSLCEFICIKYKYFHQKCVSTQYKSSKTEIINKNKLQTILSTLPNPSAYTHLNIYTYTNTNRAYFAKMPQYLYLYSQCVEQQ